MNTARIGWLGLVGLVIFSLAIPTVDAQRGPPDDDSRGRGRGVDRAQEREAELDDEDKEEDEEDEEDEEAKAPSFDFKDLCVVSLSRDKLSISGGGVSFTVDVSEARGNLRSRLRDRDSADRVVGRVVRVEGVLEGGAYLAEEVNVKNRRCADAVGGIPPPGRTPRAMRTPAPERTPTPTSKTVVQTPGLKRTPTPAVGSRATPEAEAEEEEERGRGRGRGRVRD